MFASPPHSETGSVSLYAMTILPICMTLCIAAIDLSAWSAHSGFLQNEADRIATLALYRLPDVEEARAFAEHQAASIGATATFVFDKENGLIAEVRLRSHYKPTFTKLIEAFLPEEASFFAIEKASRVQSTPSDYVLILADGESLRPGLEAHDPSGTIKREAPWGNKSSWPASGYFTCAQAPEIDQHGCEKNGVDCLRKKPLWDMHELWSDEDFQRWATQSCFNPAASTLKHAAVEFIDTVSAARANRISVLFTPGGSGHRKHQFLRHLLGEHNRDGTSYYKNQRGGFIDPSSREAEAQWQANREEETLLGGDTCILMSHIRSAMNYKYALPETPELLGFPYSVEDGGISPIEFPPCGSPHFPYGKVSDEYLEDSISLREAVYYHSAALALPGENQDPDILEALQQAWKELASTPVESIIEEEITIRGNLAHKPLRTIIIITDVLPARTAELDATLETIHRSGITIVLITFSHLGLSQSEKDALIDNTLAFKEAALQALSNHASSNSEHFLHVFEAEDDTTLRSRIIPLLAQLGRQITVRE